MKRIKGEGGKIGRKQEEAIVALLGHRSVDEAARAIGVAPKTLLRWKKMPAFQARYAEARRMAFEDSVGRIQQASTAAVTTLLKIMVDPNASDTVRARTAYYILSLAKPEEPKRIEIEHKRDSQAKQMTQAERRQGLLDFVMAFGHSPDEAEKKLRDLLNEDEFDLPIQ